MDGLRLTTNPPIEHEPPASLIRWLDWAWFGPALIASLWLAEAHTIHFAWVVARLARERWTWGALISPSADFCWSAVISSVVLPFYLGGGAASLMTQSAMRARRRIALLLLVGLILLPFVTDFLVWGSFPFDFDRQGVGRVRMIPFVPWPGAPYGSL